MNTEPGGTGSTPAKACICWFKNNLLILTIFTLGRYDWVVPTFGPWVATEDSGESHPAPSEYAIAFYSLVGVLGAGWVKATKTLGYHIAYETVIE